MVCIFKVVFIVVGVIASAFYGYFGQTILGNRGVLQTLCTAREAGSPKAHWSWWIHQIWINSMGSLIGWAAAYIVIFC